MDLHPYICKCCGGRINIAKMRCEYCDTPYENESLKRIEIATYTPGQATIRAQIAISRDHMAHSPESARDYALHELRNQIADGLLGYMKVTTSTDYSAKWMEQTEIIRAEVRVIEPSFGGF